MNIETQPQSTEILTTMASVEPAAPSSIMDISSYNVNPIYYDSVAIVHETAGNSAITPGSTMPTTVTVTAPRDERRYSIDTIGNKSVNSCNGHYDAARCVSNGMRTIYNNEISR